jgi:hypothetical protein
MDFNTTIDIIIKDLREAREIIDDLKNYPGVPQLQIELIKSKCKSAEEIITLLKTMKPDNISQAGHEAENVKDTKSSAKVNPDPLIEINDEDEDESGSISVDKIKETEVREFTGIKDSVAETDVVISEKTKDKLPETNIVADKFSVISSSLHEQLGNRISDPDLSSVLKLKPVTDLTEAIGINDKFLFVQEIFKGNQVVYNEAIEKLNKVISLSDAKAIIMSYTGESLENEPVKLLIDLVKRKLPADE